MQHPPVRPRLHAAKPELVLKWGNEISDPLARALYFFLYLTGARINEATDFSKNRLVYKEDRGGYEIYLKTLKQRSTVPVNRKVVIPINTALCHEKEMSKIVLEYLSSFQEFDHPFKKWGNMSEYLKRHLEITAEATVRRGNQYSDTIITKKFNPHYLRHCRATHLTDIYNIPNIALCHFFGWKKMDMALRYTQTSDLWSSFNKRVG